MNSSYKFITFKYLLIFSMIVYYFGGVASGRMYNSQSGDRRKTLLLGGPYTQRSLYGFLQYFYRVNTFVNLKGIQNGHVYDYAVLDNTVLEQTGGKIIQGLVNRNPNIKIIIRDVPYHDFDPKVYTASRLRTLAESNPNVIFPKNSEISDVVIDVLESFDKT